MSRLVVECVPAQDGVPVHPCGTFGGVATSPVVIERDGPETYDFTNSPAIYAWGLGMVLGLWLVGLVVGHILRIIRLV